MIQKSEKQVSEAAEATGALPLSVVPDEERVLRLMDLGQRLAMARQREGLTQKQLSELVGKSRATIVQYEQGRLQPPVQQIETMAKVLNVPPELIAFGRRGLTGLRHDNAAVTSLPEVEIGADCETVSGGHGFASGLVKHLGVEPGKTRVYVLGGGAPLFGMERGDRVVVKARAGLDSEGRLYAFRTPSGVTVARLVPQLSTTSRRVNLTGGHGETMSHDRDEVDVLGLVVGSIQAR